MSKKSEHVKTWRRNNKIRMVQSMGGCCQLCGYNKSFSALEFHHLNPEEKEIGLGSIRGNPQGWEKIVVELRKCMLVCSNCHKEIHEGISKIPEFFAKFDESYCNYKELKPKKEKVKKERFRKVDWNNVDLLELKKTYSNVKIAEMLNVSETAVRKRLKLLLV